MNKFNSRSILSNTLNFKLTNKSQSEIPMNSKGLKINENKGAGIEKYIAPQGKERAFSICNLYNKDLTEKAEKPMMSKEIMEREKSTKYNFLISKLFWTDLDIQLSYWSRVGNVGQYISHDPSQRIICKSNLHQFFLIKTQFLLCSWGCWYIAEG